MFKHEQQRVSIKRNDILMTRIGDIGTCRLIDWDVRASFYVSLDLIKENKFTNSAFLACFISSIYFKKSYIKELFMLLFPKKLI